MFKDVTSSNVRSARVSERTKELNTSSSRDSGADHGWAYTWLDELDESGQVINQRARVGKQRVVSEKNASVQLC